MFRKNAPVEPPEKKSLFEIFSAEVFFNEDSKYIIFYFFQLSHQKL